MCKESLFEVKRVCINLVHFLISRADKEGSLETTDSVTPIEGSCGDSRYLLSGLAGSLGTKWARAGGENAGYKEPVTRPLVALGAAAQRFYNYSIIQLSYISVLFASTPTAPLAPRDLQVVLRSNIQKSGFPAVPSLPGTRWTLQASWKPPPKAFFAGRSGYAYTSMSSRFEETQASPLVYRFVWSLVDPSVSTSYERLSWNNMPFSSAFKTFRDGVPTQRRPVRELNGTGASASQESRCEPGLTNPEVEGVRSASAKQQCRKRVARGDFRGEESEMAKEEGAMLGLLWPEGAYASRDHGFKMAGQMNTTQMTWSLPEDSLCKSLSTCRASTKMRRLLCYYLVNKCT
ncbi:unnamed protein product [Protopolystoma xenopodis]|uniref:Uncharacterized protein n=1 Tax=Protopolystoma xenopodis TaxID=117903 RepID=A0A448WH97_9PLAT|nr:unnamed protein product [Protopolystoma xenopodis]